MKTILTLFTLFSFTLLPLSAAPKNDKPNAGREKSADGHAKAGACKADIEKFCGAHKGNRKAMKECIKTNKDKFSAECQAKKVDHKAKKAERKAKFEKTIEICQKDIQQFCAANKDKKPMALRCLMKNRDKITPECKAALPEKRVRKEK